MKSRNQLQVLALFGVLILLVSYQNCGGKKSADLASEECLDCGLDPGTLDYKPKLNCEVRDAGGADCVCVGAVCV